MSKLPMFGPKAVRTRRETWQSPQSTKAEPYAFCMACWVDFMTVDDRDSGASRMNLHSRDEEDKEDGDYRSDPYSEQRKADLKTGEAVNAMVESLTIEHRWAIHKSQGMTTQWRFPNADYMQVLLRAQQELERKLRNNFTTGIYFV